MKTSGILTLFCITLLCLSGSTVSRAQATEPPKPKDDTKAAAKPEPVAASKSVPAARSSRIRDSKRPPRVEFEIVSQDTLWGTIVVELSPERTPITVRNFLRYVDEGFYNGTIFHRALSDFIIQGGQYIGSTEKKTEGLHGAIRNESRRGLKNERGTIAMARKHSPHTAVCQFYINVVGNEQLDYPNAGAYGYCVFGKVIKGMELVDRIARVPTSISPAARQRYERYLKKGADVKQAEKSLPNSPLELKRARRLEGDEYDSCVDPPPTPVSQPADVEDELPTESDEVEPPAADNEPLEQAEEADEQPVEDEDQPVDEPTDEAVEPRENLPPAESDDNPTDPPAELDGDVED